MLFLVVVCPSFSDTLWDPGSPGLFTGAGSLGVGDTLLVSIDIDQDLVYSSSRVDSERVSIELTGGEGQGFFSFLPTGSSSGNQSLRGRESLSFETSFAVSITGIDQNGRLILQGSRSVVIQGKQATLTLTGAADASLIGDDRTLPFSSIVDARIVYQTLLSTGVPAIGPEDIEDAPVGSGVAEETEAAEGAEAQPVAGPTAQTPVTTVPALTEERKRELLLLYLNRLIDLVFE